ncbi:hypothetical protein ETAA8_31820 [Anatilimnocola aggregata]|uniref:DUF1570 domain-containing protein n=1 Tax=Anatilimnocola aggregata TaxID=2528021 RepID=A0A517YD25_9BACT|nr:DUF1570 domain-containing protein [Anatilimnocola aggregata]QDU28089.1 hypothetical protein ETAA8_31820 [Anatilimnocola aggregata]
MSIHTKGRFAMPFRGFVLLCALLTCSLAGAVEQVTLNQAGKQRVLTGKVMVEAEDGGLLLLTPDGKLWPIPKEEITNRRSDDKLFQPQARPEFTRQLLGSLPVGFKIHQTKHYSICYNTSPGYAQWVGALYERLYSAFYAYWSRKGAELKEPEFQLAAIVFDTRANYELFARNELGDSTKSIMGYYSLHTNLVTMYDLTGLEDLRFAGDRNSAARISQVLSQPNAERNVATIVHEATHQLAFNSGLQQRFTDTPFWVSEGLAVFFETPDLDNSKGWRNVGAVNRYNLINFRKYLRTRQPGSLGQLLSDDKRFRDPATMADAYAEGWALNYFLIRTQGEQYTKYLKTLADQTPLVMQEPAVRQEQFLKFFGGNVDELESDFLKYMRGVQ